MTIFVVNDGTTSPWVLSTNDWLYVPGDVALMLDPVPISSSAPASNVLVAVDGTVVSLSDNGIFLDVEGGTGIRVSVGADGLVRSLGGNAVFIAGAASSQIVNSGEIAGYRGIVASSSGIRIDNQGIVTGLEEAVQVAFCDDATLVNGGRINGAQGILWLGSSGRIVNSGAIVASQADGAAIDAAASAGSLRLVNSGSLVAAGTAVSLGFGVDDFRNSGSVVGDVLLDAGADRFDGRGGTVSGLVNGGTGSDRLIGGEAADVLEGSGADSVAGDPDADRIEGRGGDDLLSGGFGTDRLFAGVGDDDLVGGTGRDFLFGGAGEDRFVYSAATDSLVDLSDAIRDFVAGEDAIGLDALSAGDLAFVGSAAFTGGGVAAVRVTVTAAGNSIVQVDADGDAVADMRIVVQNVALVAADFVL